MFEQPLKRYPIKTIPQEYLPIKIAELIWNVELYSIILQILNNLESAPITAFNTGTEIFPDLLSLLVG